LHAALIAGLSIISIVGGHPNIEQLVKAILQIDLKTDETMHSSEADWQIRSRIKCDDCEQKFMHRPLSPIAATKSISLHIWRELDEERVARVWDVHEGKLIRGIDGRRGIDVRKFVFITHKWADDEVEYIKVDNALIRRKYKVSTKSTKLKDIRKALRLHTQYVWMDTICIDKPNLSELDEAIRSMYKWYANCRAVVLDPTTPLKDWRERGWCLQEDATAGVLCRISNITLVSIQHLAHEQNIPLCLVDLHIFYCFGNAAEILSLMDMHENDTRRGHGVRIGRNILHTQ
jgi:hypothetical protein